MKQVAYVFVLLLGAHLAMFAMSPEATQHLQSGIDAERQQNFEKAIEEYARVTELEPKETIGYIRLGGAYMAAHQYEAAVAPLNKALEIDSETSVAHRLLGFALLAEGDAEGAIPHFEKVQESGALGIAQMQTGRAAEAVLNLQSAIKNAPNDPDLLYYLSQASEMLSQQSLDTLLSAYPDSARTHQAKAHNYFRAHELSQAESEYRQALASRPYTPGLHMELGEVYASNSQWPKAEEEFLAERKLQPANGEAAWRLGDSLLQQGKVQEALKELKLADKLRPDMSDTLFSLARAAQLAGESSTAVRAFRRVVELEKDSPLAAQAHYALAGLYRKQARAEEADREMREFRRLQASPIQK